MGGGRGGVNRNSRQGEFVIEENATAILTSENFCFDIPRAGGIVTSNRKMGFDLR
jgi:hypothetical protein